MKPMRTLLRLGHRPHALDRKKYGQPRVALYWADRQTFTHPGLYLWLGRQFRILPLPKEHP